MVKAKAKAKKNVKQPIEKTQGSSIPEFIPVYVGEQREKTEYPITAVTKLETLDIDPTNPNELIALSGKGKDASEIRVRGKILEKHVLDVLGKDQYPKVYQSLNEKALEALQDLKIAWVRFGDAILKVHYSCSYRLECNTFEEFCETRLRLHQSTVYEIMNATLFLRREKPDLHAELLEEKKKSYRLLPSYHALYLLEKKRKQLGSEKFEGFKNDLFSSNFPSTREFQERLREALESSSGKGKRPAPLWDEILSSFEAWSAKAQSRDDFPADISKDVKTLMEKLKKLVENRKSSEH